MKHDKIIEIPEKYIIFENLRGPFGYLAAKPEILP